jgi:hypothetical protein
VVPLLVHDSTDELVAIDRVERCFGLALQRCEGLIQIWMSGGLLFYLRNCRMSLMTSVDLT